MQKACKAAALVATLALAPGFAGTARAEGHWIVSGHAGSMDVDRLISRSGATWWSRVDDDELGLGASVTYEPWAWLGLRVLYEQAEGLRAENRCPSGRVCPAVAFDESVDLRAWQFSALPQMRIAPDLSLFGSIGAQYWKLKRDEILRGDSGVDFIYGVGATWHVNPRVDFGLEYQRSNIEYQSFRVNLGVRF
jgi:opacity protein-like surface antigen